MMRPAAAVRPWPALWSMIIGFFMILIDSTIVSIANPTFQRVFTPGSHDLSGVLWITSAYLLASGVPLLLAGRLGDLFGQRRVYLIGLSVFTLCSLGCGLAGSLGELIAWRAAQGVGAALLTPQTMAVITRIFPFGQRGRAMSVWGATAGIATLVGPLLGGLLLGAFGWQAIFFVNVPIGIAGFALAWRYVPQMPTSSAKLDWVGTALSGAGLFLVIFGVQQGESYSWGAILGPITVWAVIGAGLLLLALFVGWQRVSPWGVLMPLELFRVHNFRIANIGIALVGLAVTAVNVPLLIYVQSVRGMSAIGAGLILLPLAITSLATAGPFGRLLDRVSSPRIVEAPALAVWGVAVVILAWLMAADAPIGWILVITAVMGVSNSGMWAPLANAATRDLGGALAGAGSGVYNMIRTVGSVLGSAGIAALMDARIAAAVAAGVHQPIGRGLAEAMLLPAGAILLASLVVLLLRPWQRAAPAAPPK